MFKMPMLEKAAFAAGCFWGVQDAFDGVKGVLKTTAGYCGGHAKNPAYQDVCSHATGHAEAVEVEFDPKTVPYEKLLEVFWSIHDPTTPGRQGPDVGSQYRSVIFYRSAAQKKAAENSRSKLEKSGRFAGGKVVTEIVRAPVFYPAEEYHQHYNKKHGRVCAPYIRS